MGYAALRYAAGVSILAGLYYLTGKLGLLLATPPGFATVIWPAAGIALGVVLLWGMKYLPGVFLGSLIVNLEQALVQPDPAPLGAALLLGSGIACGAVLQAAAGVYLCRRLRIYPGRFDTDAAVLRFYLAAALSCFLAPLIGVTILWAAGIVQQGQLLVNYIVWFTGDALGALIFAPIAIFLLAPSHFATVQRRVAVAGSLLVAFLVFTVVQATAGHDAFRRKQLQFEQRATEIESRFRERINAYMDILVSVEGFINASEEVTYEEFKEFTLILARRYPGIQALSFNWKVTGDERAGYEKIIREQGFPEFRILDRSESGGLEVAGDRDIYFPVTYVAPYESNKRAHGFDTYYFAPGEPNERFKVLNEARDLGEVRITGRTNIVQDDDARYGLLFYHPVYHAPAKTTEERRKLHRGFCAGVFIVPDLVKSTSIAAQTQGMDFVLTDIRSDGAEQTLFDSRTPDYKEPAEPIRTPRGAIGWTAAMSLGGNRWKLEFIEDETTVQSGFPLVWSVVVSGFLFTALAGAFVLLLTGRTDRVEKLVQQRTAELERANANLERSNIDLQHFAYVASHDLQTPLRSISGFAQLLQTEFAESTSEKAGNYVFRIVRATLRMQTLIDDLLSYSRVGSTARRFEEASLQEAVNDALVMLDAVVEESGAAVTTDDDLPDIICDRSQIAQVFQNLIGNGIKYVASGVTPQVHISATKEDDDWLITVRDNGIGVPEDQQDRIFEIFRRLHTQTEYAGTGIGLALCRRIVQRHGGRIWVEPGADSGSVFRFTLPAAPPVEDNEE